MNAVAHVLYCTVDPTVLIEGKSVPALTSLLYGVCGGDADKFEEAIRLVELFIQGAIDHAVTIEGKP